MSIDKNVGDIPLSGCYSCGELPCLEEYYRLFRIQACQKCQKGLKFIAKGHAKEKYMLNDGEIAGLGFLEKRNPHGKHWAPMCLYLECQVEEIAIAKHGSLDVLQEKLQSKSDLKIRNFTKNLYVTPKGNAHKVKRIRESLEEEYVKRKGKKKMDSDDEFLNSDTEDF